MSDILDRFLFENRPVRGEIVSLSASFQTVLGNTNYPKVVQSLLGELMVAASLLTATLKFKGEIALQIQSEGPIRYAIVNGDHKQRLRAVARLQDNVSEFPATFKECFKKGVLAITLTPEDGQRYQGMVALDKNSLSECLEDYFLQSEQLLTKVFLSTDLGEQQKAAGLLVQIVPTTSESMNVENNPDFEHVAHLAATVKPEELFSLSHREVIHRLFHAEDIRIFEPQNIQFYCDCSKERSANALKSVSLSELNAIIEEEGDIKMDCQFCHAQYSFDKIDVSNIHQQNLGSGTA
jgi:molecular chaperone Hsp33